MALQHLSGRRHIVWRWFSCVFSYFLSYTPLWLLLIFTEYSDPTLRDDFWIAVVIQEKSTFLQKFTFFWHMYLLSLLCCRQTRYSISKMISISAHHKSRILYHWYVIIHSSCTCAILLCKSYPSLQHKAPDFPLCNELEREKNSVPQLWCMMTWCEDFSSWDIFFLRFLAQPHDVVVTGAEQLVFSQSLNCYKSLCQQGVFTTHIMPSSCYRRFLIFPLYRQSKKPCVPVSGHHT